MKFEDMDVWKQSSRLAVTVYQQLAELKDYGFKDQITRSSLSIPSNIAEGFGREATRKSVTSSTMPEDHAPNFAHRLI